MPMNEHTSPLSASSSNTASSHTMYSMPVTQHGQHQYAPPPSEASLAPYIGESGGRKFELRVEQQPIRARMCGFGDKDRRPITPPPCIRLIVRDLSGQEVPFDEVESTFFVLTVDLWSHDGRQEVNLVRASSGAPTISISTSTLTSYPPPIERGWQDPGPYAMSMPQRPGSYHAPGPSGYMAPVAHMPPGMAPQMPAGYPQGYAPPTPVASQMQYSQYPPQPGYSVQAPNLPVVPMPPATNNTATGMFTRNLIGSLSVNAFRLLDPSGHQGFWFVLQDLSVRTEGMFRLKMNFVNVGSIGGNGLNQGKAPVLASVFSDSFQVYSAKKFPGVIESTPLSKCFAGQGIKIPIRKDGPKPSNPDYENDD
ncbi:developmental regulator VelB [Phyllosticta citrichinensis]|uniref:Developmental regulator VelB n=1 Tax=Phyllosticta citrichinensis TaxID=1130410 RepID=A0ABR1Y3M3_9PEZI